MEESHNLRSDVIVCLQKKRNPILLVILSRSDALLSGFLLLQPVRTLPFCPGHDYVFTFPYLCSRPSRRRTKLMFSKTSEERKKIIIIPILLSMQLIFRLSVCVAQIILQMILNELFVSVLC